MGTVVEVPHSALNNIPLPPQRLRRSSIIEVIDVDSFDERSTSTAASRPVSRARGRDERLSPDFITVLDSDDDDFFSQPIASGSNTVATREGNRRYLFSPPPPPQDPYIPPVPAVPRRFTSFSSLPMRRHPPQHPTPPVVRPRDQPFDFETNMRQLRAATTSDSSSSSLSMEDSQPDLLPASPSHHTPTLGLGGALISSNRHRLDQERRDRQRREQRREQFQRLNNREPFVRSGSHMRRFYNALFNHYDHYDPLLAPVIDGEDESPAIQMLLTQDLGLGPEEFNRFDHPARRYIWQEMRALHTTHEAESPYKPEYTHLGKPEPGFTFSLSPPSPTVTNGKGKEKGTSIVIDLDSSEAADTKDTLVDGTRQSPSSSSGSVNFHTLLVCAKCLDPLVLGAGLLGEERRTKKVWALRCGHMIDGKCLDLIGSPQSAEDSLRPDEGSRWNGKGKGKADVTEQTDSNLLDTNSIRRRLRSHASVQIMPESSPRPISRVGPPFSPSSQATLGKRKRTSYKPRIEATFEWPCPVTSCGRVHVSVKIDGAWVPEPDTLLNGAGGKGKGKAKYHPHGGVRGRGAVAVFV